jgi:pimeloyl-ACP methyl ester carboxylesterase
MIGAAVAMATLAVASPRPAEPPVRVMIVGTFHFANPGLDYRNAKVDDVLTPPRQKEIDSVVSALARFQPTVIGLEWPDAEAAADYAKYQSGTLAPTRDEAVQLGFRLAQRAHLQAVRGLDTPMELPFDPVFDYAKNHGKQSIIDEITRVSDANVAAQENELKTKGIAATLRLLNDPVHAMESHGLYRDILKIGGGQDQPGLDATAMWYRRNLAICANLLQAAKPGDRVVIFFGAGHLPLLRQCVQETPGYELVDARSYLPE